MRTKVLILTILVIFFAVVSLAMWYSYANNLGDCRNITVKRFEPCNDGCGVHEHQVPKIIEEDIYKNMYDETY